MSRFDKEKNIIEETINLLVYFHRAIVKQVKQDIVNLHKSKLKGNKIGKLKFKSEVNTIPIITGGCKIIDNSHITIPGFSKLKVYGLNQLKKFEDYEIADGRFIKKASGYGDCKSNYNSRQKYVDKWKIDNNFKPNERFMFSMDGRIANVYAENEISALEKARKYADECNFKNVERFDENKSQRETFHYNIYGLNIF